MLVAVLVTANTCLEGKVSRQSLASLRIGHSPKYQSYIKLLRLEISPEALLLLIYLLGGRLILRGLLRCSGDLHGGFLVRLGRIARAGICG